MKPATSVAGLTVLSKVQNLTGQDNLGKEIGPGVKAQAKTSKLSYWDLDKKKGF